MVSAASAAIAAPASAQETAATTEESENVILVTARKRSEDIQDVPLSVAVVDDEELREANVFSFEDLAATTPGLAFTNVGTLGAPTIRGLAQTDLGAAQTNVGVFLDGIYINNRSGLEFGNMDLARIEVSKGPQSALYGRDSFAGAINYVIRDPELGEFSGYVQGEIGTDDRYGVKGSINLPLGDTAAVRVFGGYSHFDGTIENAQGGQNLGGWDKRFTIGGSVLWEPTDAFSLKLFGVRNEIEEDQPPLVVLDPFQNNGGAQYQNANGTFFTLFDGDIPKTDTVSLDNRGQGNTGDVTLLYGKAAYDFGGSTLSATVSHLESSFGGQYDNVADPSANNRPLLGFGAPSAFFLTNIGGDASEQQSYELQWASNPGSSFQWLVGASYYDSSTSLQTESLGTNVGDINTLFPISDFSEVLEQDIYSIFGAASIELGKVTIGGELRYTEEDQFLDVLQDFIVLGLVIPVPGINILADTEDDTSFDYVAGKATIEYRPNDDHLIYAYAGRGVKTGGINAGQDPDSPFYVFEPETNWTYEIGTKSRFADGQITLNTALFFIDWGNLQATTPGSINAASVVFNGPGATSKGIEVQASALITDNLQLDLSGTLLDPEYDDGFIDGSFEQACLAQTPDFVSSTCNGDVSGNRIRQTSKTQAYAAITHFVPEIFSGWELKNRIDFSHEGRRPTTSIGTAVIPAVNLFNYRMTFASDNTEISLWVDNVFDTEWVASVLPISSLEVNSPGNCGRACSVRQENVFVGNGRFAGLTVLQRF
jgi:iron complex outermembrane receptor protein